MILALTINPFCSLLHCWLVAAMLMDPFSMAVASRSSWDYRLPVKVASNPIDDASFFVRHHYLDFLNREPDSSGWSFWTNEITSCGSDAQCVEVKRNNVSAAFFLSIEFQQTGYLVERIYKAAYGDASGTSTNNGAHQLAVPSVRITDFLPDTQQIGQGVIVGQGNWQAMLENNKQAFCADFVQRARFTSAFPSFLTTGQFVDTLNTNAGFPLSQAERNQLVNSGMSRAQLLRAVAEDVDLGLAEFNRAFVLMQYIGYLRRNPNDTPDSDYTGYDFWLTKLNDFTLPGEDPSVRAQRAEMVKAFITSIEYQGRFATPMMSVLALSANPNPISGAPCGGCGSGSTDREAVTDLTIQETGGVGGTVTSVAMELRENGTNIVLASGSFDGIKFFAGTNRLQANTSLVARHIGVHYAQSLAGRSATLTYTVHLTDDNGNQVAQQLSVPVST